MLFLFLLICKLNSKLELVIEIFRHGARSGIFENQTFPQNLINGNLTNVGHR